MQKVIDNPTDVISKEDLDEYLKNIISLNDHRNTGDYWKHILGLDTLIQNPEITTK